MKVLLGVSKEVLSGTRLSLSEENLVLVQEELETNLHASAASV